MNKQSLSHKSSIRSQGQQSVSIVPAAKIHRANILCRILNSLCVVREEWSFHCLAVQAKKRRNAGKKMLTALNGVFRKSHHQSKFDVFQKLKKEHIMAGEQELTKAQKIVSGMQQSSKKIMFLTLKALRRVRLGDSFYHLRQMSSSLFLERKSQKRQGLRTIVSVMLKNKKWAFEKLFTSRVIQIRKQKVKKFAMFLQYGRKANLSWGIWKLRRNMMLTRKEEVLEEIKMFKDKINKSEDPEIKAIQEKKSKLEEHLQKIQQEKNMMEEEHNAQLREIQKQKQQLEEKKQRLIQQNQQLDHKIKELEEEMKVPYTMDEIYQCLYNNFLLYISQNKEQAYNKEEVLASFTQPLVPIDVPVQAIKEENKVMQELINEYVVMFGHKKLQQNVELPYEYLVKENYALYKMLMTLLPQTETDREDLRVLKDGIFKLNARVNEVWGI